MANTYEILMSGRMFAKQNGMDHSKLAFSLWSQTKHTTLCCDEDSGMGAKG